MLRFIGFKIDPTIKYIIESHNQINDSSFTTSRFPNQRRNTSLNLKIKLIKQIFIISKINFFKYNFYNTIRYIF
jgi:hypothetical protein